MFMYEESSVHLLFLSLLSAGPVTVNFDQLPPTLSDPVFAYAPLEPSGLIWSPEWAYTTSRLALKADGGCRSGYVIMSEQQGQRGGPNNVAFTGDAKFPYVMAPDRPGSSFTLLQFRAMAAWQDKLLLSVWSFAPNITFLGERNFTLSNKTPVKINLNSEAIFKNAGVVLFLVDSQNGSSNCPAISNGPHAVFDDMMFLVRNGAPVANTNAAVGAKVISPATKLQQLIASAASAGRFHKALRSSAAP
jgi:hypothetical protein